MSVVGPVFSLFKRITGIIEGGEIMAIELY